jgi:transposase
MKKGSTVICDRKTTLESTTETVVGLDLGDRFTAICVLSRATGEVLEEGRFRTTTAALRRRFEGAAPAQLVLETGTHSPWVSELLEGLGHEVLVANARQVALIYQRSRKNDRVDAQTLARLLRVDPELLAPIRHRARETRADLALLRSRTALVQTRTRLVNHCRGTAKSLGERIPSCSTKCFPARAAEALPEGLASTLSPVLETLAVINEQIHALDERIETLAREHYPEHERMTQVGGVGDLTAMTFLLTIEDPARFAKNRSVGAYLGLAPGQDESGSSSPQKRITKEGDEDLRRLLVQCAHSILGPFGKDSDLRRHGLKLAERGGKNAKKRAAVAVARKLAVLLLKLWRTGEQYEPLRNAEAA